jgi:hypothetical protein
MNHPYDMVLTANRAKEWLQPAGKDEIEHYILSRLNPDGGFCGRSSTSDLYYTVFGLASLTALNSSLPEEPLRLFLASAGDGTTLDFVHLASAARCWAVLAESPDDGPGRSFLQRMEAFRSQDGGYHHLERQALHGTVYGSFLAFMAYEETGVAMPASETLLTGLQSLRTADGGYANAAGMALSTTTAAAATLLLQQWILEKTEPPALRALQSCECPTGGYLPFPGAPGPDLLSTATALYALRQAGQPTTSPLPHGEFIESLWCDNGGFCGHPADLTTDCEYTFYALLALGACAGLPGVP